MIGHLIAMLIMLGIGIVFELRMSWSTIGIVAADGLIIQGGGAICYRVGNLIADDLWVNG